MAKYLFRVQHRLLERLRLLDQEAKQLFGASIIDSSETDDETAGNVRDRFLGSLIMGDAGLGCLGLTLDEEWGQIAYDCTPPNCMSFARTGIDGTHFSLVARGRTVKEDAPVAITIPSTCCSWIVGEDLHDFLCLGYYRGYTAIDQLSCDPEPALKIFTDPHWRPSEAWHNSVGYVLDEHKERIQHFLIDSLGLKPWPNSERFQQLQERFESWLEPRV